jgi:thioredoxin 1
MERIHNKMNELTLTKTNFEEEVLRSDLPVLVDFWATWCGPCRMLAPVIAEIAESHKGILKVGKVNVDEQPELAAAYRIDSIPAVFLFRGGKVDAKSIGYCSLTELESGLGL